MTIEERLSLLEQQIAAQVPTPTEYYTSRWSGEEIDNRIASLSNQNLLDNWYFVGGGSQQGGGQFPINQRGETEYNSSGSARTVSVDRWGLDPNNGIVSITLNSYGIRLQQIEAGNNAQSLSQAKEASFFQSNVTYTLSVFCKGTGKLQLLANANDGQFLKFTAFDVTNDYAPYAITFTFPQITSNTVSFWIYPDVLGNLGYIDVLAAKLELGSHQTIARQDADGNWVLLDPPPNFQQELAKCQRYLLILSGFGWIGSGVVDDTSTGQFFLPTPVSMRITPTMAGLFRIYNHINNFQVTTATASGHTENGINGMITFTGSTFQVGDAFSCWLNTNEKLMLSAEL